MTALAYQEEPPAFDVEKSAAFEEQFVAMLNAGTLSLMVSLGHRSGLYDTMAGMPPATSAEIAEQAGLNERYVREWLGAMTVGRIVEHDGDAGTYRLPAEHAACLTRAAAPNNLAVFAQYVPVLGSVEDDILHCFRHGGGVAYDRFPRFHEVMAEDSGQSVLPVVIDHILPLAAELPGRLADGIRVLDVGCGRGKALHLMAWHYPNSTFVGYDLSEDAVAYARAEAEAAGLTNVSFEARDLSDFDTWAEEGAFDLVTTFDAVHDQGQPRNVLAGIRKSLAPDGIYLCQDINSSSHHHNNMDHPLGPTLYTVSCMHCMTVSLAQGGDGLGAMWGRELAETMFREAGFADVAVHELDHDVQNCYFVCRP